MASSLNDYQVNGPDWAKGCEACEFGIVAAPPILGALPLHEQRAVAHAEEMILFCECRAAYMYRQYLRKLYNAMSIETRKNVYEHLMAARVPTVHFEGAA
jgi:hypothetical protein